MRNFRDHPRKGAIQMINLLKFHDRAQYQAAHVHRETGLAHQQMIECRPGGDAIA